MNSTRNLIVLFDGTWNHPNDASNYETNVIKLYRLLPDTYADDNCIYYEEGVGTKTGEEILGGVFGEGIDQRILGAYRFLQSKFLETPWRPEQDKIFIFGFSRGAYTARTFAQLLYYCGIPNLKGNTQLAWEYYYNQDIAAANSLKGSGNFSDIDIEMLGLWDTVKSTLDGDRNDTQLYPNVKVAYHAISIDEKRKNFSILRFYKDNRVSEVWFPGVHSDIGGGYKSKESQLSDITLLWMINAAKKHGLEFVSDYESYIDPNPIGTIHDSFQGFWIALGSNIRRVGEKDLVHISVKERIKSCIGYAPSNIPQNPIYTV